MGTMEDHNLYSYWKDIANKEVLLAGPLGEYKPTHPAIKVTLGRVSISVYVKCNC